VRRERVRDDTGALVDGGSEFVTGLRRGAGRGVAASGVVSGEAHLSWQLLALVVVSGVASGVAHWVVCGAGSGAASGEA